MVLKPIKRSLFQKKKISKLNVNILKSQVYKPGKYNKNFIETIKFRTANGRKILLGKGTFGKVYLGDVKFQDGSRKKVAIKVYNLKKTEKVDRHIIKIQEQFIKEKYKEYENVLDKLKKINIPKGLINNLKEIPIIPKSEILLIDNQLVFISQGFANLKNNLQTSKLVPNKHLPVSQDINYNKKKIYLESVVYSLGSVVTKDMFIKFKDRPEFLFLDLDALVFNEKIKPEQRASAFIDNLFSDSLDTVKNPKTKKELFEFTKKMLREDKNNFETTFKTQVCELLDKMKI